MTLCIFKIFSAIIILMIAIIGGIWPFVNRINNQKNINSNSISFDFPTGEALASGIFLGVGLLHMLPDSVAEFSIAGYHYPLAFFFTAVSFLLLLLLEHITASLHNHSNNFMHGIIFFMAVMLSIHSFLEGTAVGISVNFATAVIIFMAIIAHKGAASFALSVHLNRSYLKLTSCIITFSIFCLITPLGIFAGSWFVLTSHRLFLPIINSLAAGTFLYIGTLHGLERTSLVKIYCNIKEIFFMLIGFSLIGIITIFKG